MKPDWNIGYTTRNHLCLDLDNSSITKVYSLASLLIREHPELGDCLIVQSSHGELKQVLCHQPMKLPYHKVKRDSFHLIFNNTIPYEESCKIIETLARLDVISEAFIRIREMRNDMTLRVSKTVNVTHVKPPPQIVGYKINYKVPKKGNGIGLYLALLNCLL